MTGNNDEYNGEPNDGRWVDLCDEEQVPAEGGLYVAFQGRGLAVFRLDGGRITVVDDSCPHAGGSLSAGRLEDLDGRTCVICPWHCWPFDAQSGECPDNPVYRTRTYPVRVTDGRVRVQVPAEE